MFGQSRTFHLPSGISEKDYDPHTIIIKLKKYAQKGGTAPPGIAQLASMINANKFKKALPSFSKYHQKTLGPDNDLSETYKIIINDSENLESKINQLLAQPNVAYAEPYYLPRPLFIPNDPAASSSGSQTYLSIIRAYEAWEFEKGDSTVIIGVLDTGVDLNHEDLAENIYYNEHDPINGIDDDEDGYVDNYHGWDFANNDNDPTADFSQHGTSVAGISSARTNNSLGVAGVGFKCKFLPIKIFDTESNTFNNGYEAILYAAEQGCKVVNLSWGGVDLYSNFAQDIINFVVLDMDVVVVAAAGNTNEELNFYPASYENVLSVGASNNNDQKAGFATYSHFIDVMAPGANEYTTKNGNNYGNTTGSSFASPMVAGIAALVRSKYSGLNARQVMEKIRITADDIYSIAGNEAFFEKLGRGRVNARNAVAPNNRPAIRMSNLSYNNQTGPYAAGGDMVTIKMDFTNMLNATANATAVLTCSSPFVTIVEGSFDIGSLAAMEQISNDTSPFLISLASDVPANETLSFRIGYEDINYSDYQYFELTANPDYFNLDNGKILFTIAGNGNLGYIDSDLENGSGLVYQGKRLIDHIGIAFGTGPDKLVDNIIYDLSSGQKNSDFNNTAPLQFVSNSIAPIDVRSTFNDANATDPINLQITQKLLSATADSANSFIIIEYRVTNTSGGDLASFHTGLFADWNIGQYTTNKAAWDELHKLGYIHDPGANDQFAGIALISGQQAIYNAIDLASENGNEADYAGTFDKSSKYNLLTNSESVVAGASGAGNNVAQFLAGRTVDLKNNHSTKVTFVIAVEESLETLQNIVTAASAFYTDYLQNPPVSEVFNVCKNESIDVNPTRGINYRFFADVDTTQFLGEGEFFTTGALVEDQAYFVINTDMAYDGDIEHVKVVVKEPKADFLISRDTVFLDESLDTAVEFKDLTLEGVSWDWDFGNGFFSNAQNPVINFVETGIFNVNLDVETATGCLDSSQKKVVVVNRGPQPDTPDFQICPNETIILQATNASYLSLYSDESITTSIASGSAITVENLNTDTILYLTNKDSLYESLPAKIHVEVSEIGGTFNYFIDSLELNEKAQLIFESLSPDASTWTWHLDDDLVSTDQHFKILPSEEKDITVKLMTENLHGCKDSSEQVVSIKKSSRPLAAAFRFCAGTKAIISLHNSSFYNFYEDKDLNTIIGKGNSIDLGDLLTSKTIYYTNLDSLLESEANTIEAQVIDKFANFDLENENIHLGENSEVILHDLSPFSVGRQWYVDNRPISPDSSFSPQFEASGNYVIKLLAENDIGCIDSVEKSLKVLLVTGLEGSSTEKNTFFHPNPSSGTLYINSEGLSDNIYRIKIFDQLGKTVFRKKYFLSEFNKGIFLNNLHPGVYYFELSSKNQHYSPQKLIFK